jgi:hypothetical protein
MIHTGSLRIKPKVDGATGGASLQNQHVCASAQKETRPAVCALCYIVPETSFGE